MKFMTRKQLYDVCIKHEYILVRDPISLKTHAINCKVAKLGGLKEKVIRCPDAETNYSSFIPCNFMEYISNKTAFI